MPRVGGGRTLVNSFSQAVCQGNASGRWSLVFGALEAIQAGTWMSLRRIGAGEVVRDDRADQPGRIRCEYT
jgi:hypothetical protein